MYKWTTFESWSYKLIVYNYEFYTSILKVFIVIVNDGKFTPSFKLTIDVRNW